MTFIRRGGLGALLAVVAVSGVALAQSPPPSTSGRVRPGIISNPDSALAMALAEIEGDDLALEDAVAKGLAQSTIAREAEADLSAARGAVRREKGAFDPELFAGSEWRGDEIPAATPFAGAEVLETEDSKVEGGARIQLPFGTEVEASLESARLSTNSIFAALNPQYDAAGKLAVRQPLLKGFGPSTRSELSAAERELEASTARYDDATLAVRTDVEKNYWDLYAAARDLAVQRLIRDGAAALVQQAELRAGVGLVGPGDVANARVFLAEQEQFVIDREEALDTVSDNLASLIGQRPVLPSLRYRPTAEPPRDFPVESPDSLVSWAVTQNRALQAGARRVEAVQALADGAKWDALPTLDVFGTLGGVGLAGDQRDVIFGGDTLRTSIYGDRGDATSDALARDFPNWSAGIRVEFPLGLREGRGERDRLRAEVARAREQVRAQEYALEQQVRVAHRELANSTRRLEAATRGVEASREQVRIGSLEYQAGRSTAFELVRLAADLATAEQRYSQALVRTAKAAAELRRLTAGVYPTGAATPSP
jgi:outer membrane protein TolC